MLCDICKMEEATIFYKEIINDKYTEMSLCEKCAYEKGIKKFQFPMAITNLLSGLAEIGMEELPKEAVKKGCPSCGFTYSNFQEKGKLGCGECYQFFSEPLSNILRKIHGNIKHIGKSPVMISVSGNIKREIEALRQALNEAIKQEAYEEAAKLRDKIRELEKKL